MALYLYTTGVNTEIPGVSSLFTKALYQHSLNAVAVFNMAPQYIVSTVAPVAGDSATQISYLSLPLNSENLTIIDLKIITDIRYQFFHVTKLLNYITEVKDIKPFNFRFSYIIGLSTKTLTIPNPIVADYNLINEFDLGVIYTNMSTSINASFPFNPVSWTYYQPSYTHINKYYNLFQKNYFLNVVTILRGEHTTTDIDDVIVSIENRALYQDNRFAGLLMPHTIILQLSYEKY